MSALLFTTNASGKCCTVTQKVREASSGASDSDDEQVADPAIPPAFTDSELLVVQTYHEKLCSAFRSAVVHVHHFTNAAGKTFFYHLVEFILILHPNKQYVPYISTNPHGDCQPGSANITHTIPKPCIVRLKSPWIRVAGSLTNDCELRVCDLYSLAEIAYRTSTLS